MKSYLKRLVSVVAIPLAFAAWPVRAATYPDVFEEMPGYPAMAGPVVADVLGDGRFILYEGLGSGGGNIYIEHAKGSGTFSLSATGYQGDPAFIAVAPDGHTCLIGGGAVDWLGDPSNDWVWLFDADHPADAPATDPGTGYVSDGLALVLNNWWGAWLNEHLVLMEAADAMWVGEIGILDVNAGVYRKVVDKQASTAACVLGAYQTSDWVFSTVGYGATVGETRRFNVQALIGVFESPSYNPATSPLSWESGALVGTYADFGAGPSAVGEAGTLIFGSLNGRILYVDGATGEQVGEPIEVPEGGNGSVRPYFNPRTGRILVTETDWAMFTHKGYLSIEKYAEFPAATGAGLALLAGALALAARRRLRK
ncbi:MAG TPA: hypothetical protein ENN80_06575 [Candidatus Hydrogenedentes bacterium]|nr:hypothetical protein [Candidatus Hydrogenedentota bacterium]